MKLYIKPSELIIDHTGGLPTHVADKMMIFHILPVNTIRFRAGYAITASDRSGYRSKEHEIKKGRRPTPNKDWSRHTYEPELTSDPEGKGATDWRTVDLRNMKDFARKLIDDTDYSRLCYYPDMNFIHSDYKHESRGKRLFLATADGWKQMERNEFIDIIH